MKADSISMLEFLGSEKTIFEIPVYQRNYEWTKKQCKQLFSDLTFLASNLSKHHFLGTVAYIPQSGNKLSKIRKIIDGQQRITSCMLLLKAISTSDDNLKNEIEDEYLRNKYLNQNNHLKLKPVDKDNSTYVNIINNNIEYSDPSKMIDNYNYFKELIKKYNYSTENLFNSLGRMDIAYIELNNDSNSENPQVIFEAINSTGVSLSDSDLIRNFLLMGINTELQNNLYYNYWEKIENLLSDKTISDFVHHYLIMKTHKKIGKKKIYIEYKRLFNYNNYTSEEAVKELYKYSIDYKKIIEASFENEKLNKSIEDINTMNKKVVYPYILKVLNLKHNNIIDSLTLIDIVKQIESYLYRLFICNYPTNQLNDIFSALCSSENYNNEKEKLQLVLLKNNFPTNTEFKDALIHNDLYKKHGSKSLFTKMTLANIESKLTKETVNFDNAQVEHIMPQRLNEDWLISVNNADNINNKLGNTLGNLTLTKYNQQMSNDNYNIKKKFYKKSNIYITRELANKYPIWDKDSIINRSKALSNIAIEIWSRPANSIKSTKNNIKGEYNLYSTPNVTGHQLVKLMINDETYPVHNWTSMLRLILNYVWELDSASFKFLKKNYTLNNSVFKNLNEIIRPTRLINGEYVESHFHSKAIISIIKIVANIYDITANISYVIQ